MQKKECLKIEPQIITTCVRSRSDRSDDHDTSREAREKDDGCRDITNAVLLGRLLRLNGLE